MAPGTTDASEADDLRPGVDLAGRDLSGRDLRGKNLSGADLSGANLAAADLSGSRLVGTNLAGASLVGADLSGANLLNADLSRADASESRSVAAIFGGASLRGAVLFNADLSDATLSNCDAHGCDLRASTLRGARLVNTDLQRANLQRANLHSADLTGAQVDHANFTDADLERARLKNLTGFEKARWVGVGLTDVDFTGAHLLRRTINDENYLHEFANAKKLNRYLFTVWRLTSDCGRSLVRWGLVTLAVAVAFALAYTAVDIDYGDHRTALSPLYFSIVTLSTLGYGDVLPASTHAQLLVMVEVVLGHVMLGGLLSIFATRMARRAD